VATTLRSFRLIDELEQLAPAVSERERALADLTVQLMQAQEGERRRIALDLHDDPLQRAILLAREMTEAPEHPRIRRWRTVVGEIIDGLRATSAALRPRNLDDFVVATAWDSFLIQADAFSRAQGTGDLVGAAESVVHIVSLALPTLGLTLVLFGIGRRLFGALWRWSRPTPARRVVGTLASVGVIAAVGFLWAPQLPLLRGAAPAVPAGTPVRSVPTPAETIGGPAPSGLSSQPELQHRAGTVEP